MRVLFLTNIPSPYRMDFFNAFGKYCDLTVTFEGRNATDRDADWKSAEAKNFHTVFLKGIRTGADQFLCPGIITWLKQPWDAIIVGGYSTPTGMLAIEWMRLHHKKFYIEADGGLVRKDRLWKYRMKKHLISSADAWFSSGEPTTDYLVHYGAIRERCYQYPFTSLYEADIIKNSRDRETRYTSSRQRLHEEGITEKSILLCVTRMIPIKGTDVLLRAAEYLPRDIGICIVGGEPTDELNQLMQNPKIHPERIHFVGFKNKDELREYYCAADALVLPTRGDVWGLVINEAMSYGIPVITTTACVAGMTLIKDRENGRVVESDNPKMLAEGIIETLSNQKTEYRHKSLETIREYTMEKMAERHMSIIKYRMSGIL